MKRLYRSRKEKGVKSGKHKTRQNWSGNDGYANDCFPKHVW